MSKAHPVNIVLVHGGFVDGSGWEGVHAVLKKDGYRVSIVQNPTTSLADDVAVTKRTLAQQDGPAILVGHSYGGVVITEAGTDPRVLGLVYIAAFAPDAGAVVASLIKNPPPGAPVPPILPPQDGYLFLDARSSRLRSRRTLTPKKAAFMADSQVPWGTRCSRRLDHGACLEDQAELVSGRHRRPHDPRSRPARDGHEGGRR